MRIIADETSLATVEGKEPDSEEYNSDLRGIGGYRLLNNSQ
jgi:hypothetical protein